MFKLAGLGSECIVSGEKGIALIFTAPPLEYNYLGRLYNARLSMCPLQELVSDATRVKYDRVREQITVMHQVVSSMLSIAQNMEFRSTALSEDMKRFAHNMR